MAWFWFGMWLVTYFRLMREVEELRYELDLYKELVSPKEEG